MSLIVNEKSGRCSNIPQQKYLMIRFVITEIVMFTNLLINLMNSTPPPFKKKVVQIFIISLLYEHYT